MSEEQRDILQIAERRRESLKSELAKIEEFLVVADKLMKADGKKSPNFFLATEEDPPVELH